MAVTVHPLSKWVPGRDFRSVAPTRRSRRAWGWPL